MPIWDDYRYFLAVARQGSLSGAARVLGVSQPTVGRRIEQLESDLALRLFDRQALGFQLTAAGRDILASAEAMEREEAAIGRCLERHRQSPQPVVRIATTLGLATGWLAAKLARFQAQNPEIPLATKVGIDRADLHRYDADIALRMGDPGEDELFGRRVGTVHCGLYAGRGYLAAHGTPATLVALAHHVIVESDGEIADLAQVVALRKLAGNARRPFTADSVAVQIAALRRDMGIAAIPCFMADTEPDLLRILPSDFDVAVDLWLLVNRSLRDQASVRRLFRYLIAEAAADAALFRGEWQTA